MKRTTFVLLGAAAIAGASNWWLGQQTNPGDGSTTDLLPAGEVVSAVPNDSIVGGHCQAAGWVFGRVIGCAGAPGSPNHSPFGTVAAPNIAAPATRLAN